jgi:hypothetical protein
LSLARALIALMLSAVILCGCQSGAASPSRRPPDAAELVRQVSLGRTTAPDVERQFGVADDRPADGSLVYQFARTRGHGEPVRTETETVTLHFAHGVLSKICRTRS